LLPPDFKGDAPAGYIVVRSKTYNGYALFRSSRQRSRYEHGKLMGRAAHNTILASEPVRRSHCGGPCSLSWDGIKFSETHMEQRLPIRFCAEFD